MLIIDIVGPVFLLIAVGFLSVRFRLFPVTGIAGLVSFVNNFATPCLLFRAMLSVDFRTAFNPGFLLSFYIGTFVVFAVAIAVARYGFGRRPGESVVAGFAAYFTNTVLIGLPIVQRAYGETALPLIYAIIGLHSPLLMSCGTIVVELARRDGEPVGRTLRLATQRIATNPLLIGIALGLSANLFDIPLPKVINDATEMMTLAVLPAALFGMGGALNQYKLRESYGQAVIASVLKLVLHPLIALLLAVFVFKIPWELTRVAVLMAAIPSGLNVYVFATFYQRVTDVAANTILIATVMAVATVSLWLLILDQFAAYRVF
jgi:predicted permease